jgi:phosphoribosylaminoimidazole-succinocarboxamide synthase
MADALLATDLALPNKRTGKVRDLYDVTLASGDEALLIIATDRISAFDVVMQNGLPGKGVVLTQISSSGSIILPVSLIITCSAPMLPMCPA